MAEGWALTNCSQQEEEEVDNWYLPRRRSNEMELRNMETEMQVAPMQEKQDTESLEKQGTSENNNMAGGMAEQTRASKSSLVNYESESQRESANDTAYRKRAFSTGNQGNCRRILSVSTSFTSSSDDSDRLRAYSVGSKSRLYERKTVLQPMEFLELPKASNGEPRERANSSASSRCVSPAVRMFTATSLLDLVPKEPDDPAENSDREAATSLNSSRTSLSSSRSRQKCCTQETTVGAEEIELQVTEAEEDLPSDVLPPNSVHPMAEEIHSYKLWAPHIEGHSWWYLVRMILSIIAHVVTISLGLTVLVLCGNWAQHFSVIILCGLLLLFCYVVTIVEACLSKEFKYLKQMWENPDAKSYIQKLHCAKPIVIFKVTCYHHVTKLRKEPILNGRRVEFRQVSYRDRETRHKEETRFSYQQAIEMSPLDVDFLKKKTIRINFFRTMSFGSEDARQAFAQQLETLRAKNRPKDKHMSFAVDYRLPGFEPQLVCFVDSKYRRWMYRPWMFVIATVTLMSFPYRCWFRYNSGHTDFTFHKQFR